MGGNALKNTFTRRYMANEYYGLVTEVIEKMLHSRKVVTLAEIPAYKEKESFGDMDILYSTYDDIPLSVDEVKIIFNPKEIKRNSEVISFDLKELQIDLIHCGQKEYDYAYNYFSYNDCGNLVGKLAHQLGLKHGHKGLVLPLRDGIQHFEDVLITLDHDKTLKLLELDVNRFNSAFANLDEIFDFISKSSYYSPENYKLENLNSIAKIRDRKRDTYRKFLEYGENWKGVPFKKTNDKTGYLAYIFECFPDAVDRYNQAMYELNAKKSAKEKFNANLVSSLTGLEEKALGELMKKLRKNFYFSTASILYLSDAQISKNILEIFNESAV